MGNRREERVPIVLRALVWGADADGKTFVEPAQTLDISATGARLHGLARRVHVGAIIGVEHGDNRGRFRVVWVGKPGTSQQGQVGLRCVALGQRLSKTVLYVDDQEYEREQRGSLLRSCGYEVTTAATGRDAQELAATHRFDIIVVDHPLLDMDCETFLHDLKRVQPTARVIVVSAYPGKIPENVMALAGAFVHKGDAPHKLICTLEEMIGPATQVKWPITRCHQRYAVAMPVSIQVIRGGVGSRLSGQMRDLNEDGMAATVEGDLAPGEIVTAIFALPTATEPFRVHATVRRRDGNDYGFAFVDVTPEQQQSIRMLCGVLPPRESLQDAPIFI